MNVFKRTFGFIHQHPLAKNHLARAYYNFFSWQIKSRLQQNLQPIKFIGETYFYAKKGLSGVTGNIYVGLHEFNDMGFLLHFLRPEDTFLDIGANVGSYTLLASGVCRSKTYSFEPALTTFEILKENIDLNNINHLVTLENKGVGSENKNINFTTSQDTTNHIVLEEDTKELTTSVPLISLNSYPFKDAPILIKIDVEGFETEVLNGASQILTNPNLKAIIIELNGCGGRYGFDEEEIHQKLISHSFIPVSYDPFDRKISELKTYGAFNTIYIRDMNGVNSRLSSAAGFTLFNEII